MSAAGSCTRAPCPPRPPPPSCSRTGFPPPSWQALGIDPGGAALAADAVPLGRALAGLRVRREPLEVLPTPGQRDASGKEQVIWSAARLWLGGPIAIVTERIYQEFLDRLPRAVDGAVTAVPRRHRFRGRQPPRARAGPGGVLAERLPDAAWTATIVTIGLPAIGRSLHAGVSGLQWSVDAYTVTLASLLMFSGAAADRYGRRGLLQAGLSLFVLGSWLCSLAPGLGCLIAFRVIQGAGASAMNPAALGIITSVFPDPARRARAIGVWDAAYGLSMVAGPVAGGILVSRGRLAGGVLGQHPGRAWPRWP